MKSKLVWRKTHKQTLSWNWAKSKADPNTRAEARCKFRIFQSFLQEILRYRLCEDEKEKIWKDAVVEEQWSLWT